MAVNDSPQKQNDADPFIARLENGTKDTRLKAIIDLDKDTELQKKYLDALLKVAKDDRDPYVKKQAWILCKKILNSLWVTKDETEDLREERFAAFSKFLTILKEEDQDDWEVQRAAADWLMENAKQINKNKLAFDALGALLVRANNGSNPNVLQSTISASLEIWNTGWQEQQQVILYQVLRALKSNNWQIRQAAADWLKDKAEEIAKDKRMMVNILQSLTEIVKDDSQLDTRRSAWSAVQAIWERGWDQPDSSTDGSTNRQVVFNEVLKFLNVDEDDDDWVVRRDTANWLGEDKKPKEIAGNERMTTSVLDALLERAKKDSHPDVRMSAVKTCQKIWNAGWQKSPQIKDKLGLTNIEEDENRQNFILIQVLKLLRFEPGAFWEIRKAAADWLKEKSKEIANKPYETYKEVADILNLAVEGDPEPEVRNSAKTALSSLWKDLKKEYKKYLDDIKSKIKEDEKTYAIRRLADPATLGSREAMVALVGHWIDWIQEDGEERFVELTADAIRYNKYAILPLVEQFKKHRDKTQQIPWFRRVVSPSQRGPATPITDGQEIVGPQLRVRRRIARQLSAMSDRSLFDLTSSPQTFDEIVKELRQHAVPVLVKLLPDENDIEILEDIARTLARTRDREAVEALVQEVVGVERERKARQDLIAEYYLKPSKAQSDQATKILGEAVSESRETLRILQLLNSALFVVGLVVLAAGLYISFTNEDGASRVAGALAGIGGLGGMIRSMVKKPLNRIQNAIANMVQMQTAFTSFIWEMNANGTYIQSRYVMNGKLENQDIRNTVRRMENSMEKTIDLVSTYVEEGVQRTIIRIDEIIPAVREAGRTVTINGQHLLGDNMQQSNLVFIDHEPLEIEWDGKENRWNQHQVTFTLPGKDKIGFLPEETEKTVWISLSVDDKETNALPFRLLKPESNIDRIMPVEGEAGNVITIHGQLLGDTMQGSNFVLIDHKPLEIKWDGKKNRWKDYQVTFTLPEEDKTGFLPEETEKTVWISLSVDGKETNALPFHLLKHKKPARDVLQRVTHLRVPSNNVLSRIVDGARNMFVVLFERYKARFNR